MDFGTHQVVSEHSILSAQRNIRDDAMEFREEASVHSEQEWLSQLEEIKQLWKRRTKGDGRRSRHDHAPCRRRRRNDELSEKDYEIYLDMKLHWLQKFYVTAKSREPEESEKEPKEEGWKEEFKTHLKFQELEEVVKPEAETKKQGGEWKTDFGMSNRKSKGGCDKVAAHHRDDDDQKTPPEKLMLEEASLQASKVVWTISDFAKQFLSLATEECDLDV